MIKHVVLDRLYPEVFLTRSNSRIFSDFSGGGGFYTKNIFVISLLYSVLEMTIS